MADTAASEPPEQKPTVDDNVPGKLSEGFRESETSGSDKPPEWVEWRESSDSIEIPPPSNTANTSDAAQLPSLPNGEIQVELEGQPDVEPDKTVASPTSADGPADNCKAESGGSPDSKDTGTNPSQSTEVSEENQSIGKVVDSHSGGNDTSGPAECEKDN